MPYEEALAIALMKIDSLDSGTEFGVKDLFEGTFWNNLDKGTRLNVGRNFKNRVDNNLIPEIQYIGKAANNSARYRKVEVRK